MVNNSFSIVHDPGGRRIFSMPEGMIGSAHMSECGRYRHSLTRCWGKSGQSILFIGLNPSTATEDKNDPTIVREIAFAKREGFDFYVKVNLMDYRATDPKALLCRDVIVRSEYNTAIILEAAISSNRVVAAWGALHKKFRPYAEEIRTYLAMRSITLSSLGMTKDGFPRHPLYVRSNTPLSPY